MKGFFKRFAAVALAGVMTLGLTIAATAAETETSEGTDGVTGDGTVTDITYNVLLTKDLGFDINKYSYKAPTGDPLLIETSQITAPEFPMENQTPAMHVEITYDLTLELKSDVEFATAEEADNQTDGTKTAYFAAIGAKEASAGVIATTATEFVFDVDEPGTLVPFVENEDDTITAQISFALQPYDTALAEENVAAFTFYGIINHEAAWADNDLKITGECTLSGMSKFDYAELGELAGMNQIPGTPIEEAIGFTDAGSASATVSKVFTVSNAAKGDVVIGFNFGGYTETGLTVKTVQTSAGSASRSGW